MEVKTLGVVGAGLMGNGIAHVGAMSGLQVIMSDIKDEFVQRGLDNVSKILSRSVDKAKMSAEEKDAILSRIKSTVDNNDMSAADFVVEAATENELLKFQIFQDLDEICRPEVILATNTSSIPIGRIAAQTQRP
jgi:3-hydroxybutyryl-CoA dehydrogenase